MLAPLLDPAVALRAFYLAASALILVTHAVPALRSRFVAYGPRATSPPSGPPPALQRSSALDELLDYVAGIRVPHKYFSHFYLLSVICSLAWGVQLWRLGWFSNGIAVPYAEGQEYTMFSQMQIVWGSMLLQGFRRLLETRFFSASSKSKMWVGHWVLGLLFYLTINMAIWVEIASDAEAPFPYNWLPKKAPDADPDEELQSKLVLLPPAIFAFHALQHIYHAYLWRIRTEGKGYQLPSHPLFPDLLCPHYTCEIVIYILLSFLAAPTGHYVNGTLIAATVLAFVNLAVTSIGTKEWYEKQFGTEKVRPRKRMIPYVW